MKLPDFIVKTSVIVWSGVLLVVFVVISLAAISVMGTKAGGKFKTVATPPGTTQPAPLPDTPEAQPAQPPGSSQPSKNAP